MREIDNQMATNSSLNSSENVTDHFAAHPRTEGVAKSGVKRIPFASLCTDPPEPSEALRDPLPWV